MHRRDTPPSFGTTSGRATRTVWALVVLLAVLSACSTARDVPSSGYEAVGIASWYGGKFHGRKTASGAIFDQNGHTAAHRSLPFGTRVRVTNLENGRSVVLVVNDRGPFVRGRIIDVSRRAAAQLGFLRKGLTRVRVEVIQIGKG